MSTDPPSLLERLKSGDPLLGIFVKTPRREVVEILALEGFDFLVIDTEHSQIDEAAAWDLLHAARAASIPALVRVAALDVAQANRLVEAGAAGLQLSSVTTRSQVDDLISSTSYPPHGNRGFSVGHPAARYGRVDTRAYVEAANASVFRVGQFETTDPDVDVDLLVNGLDVLFVGRMDMSAVAGAAGDLDHPAVLSAVDRARAASQRSDVPLGTWVPDAAGAAAALAVGYSYVVVGSDLSLLAASARGVLNELRGQR